MSQKTTARYCAHCDRKTLAVKNTPNHVLHVILSIVTVGVWLPVWFLVAFFNLAVSYRCNQCGSRI